MTFGNVNFLVYNALVNAIILLHLDMQGFMNP